MTQKGHDQRYDSAVARNIRALLAGRGWTQEKAAELLRTDRKAVSELCRGRRRLTADMALRLNAVDLTSAARWLALQNEDDLDAAQAARTRRR